MEPRRFSLEEHGVASYARALSDHAAGLPLMFMVPAHAATPEGLSEDLADFLGPRALELDVPPLVDGIDVGDESPFARARALAEDAWGARRSWFLSNGSSQGNRMALIAAAGRGSGSFIAVQRSAHSSLTDGLVLSGLTPAPIQPSLDVARGVNHGLTPSALEEVLTELMRAGTRACAAYVISPSYFGALSDVRGLAEVAHAHGVPLVVDAAWGAHFGFHPELPDFPTAHGADIVVTSTHKMGGSLGQSAMLHLAEGPFAADLEPLLDRAYRLTQTTSASSLLLASLDVARRALVTRPGLLRESIALAAELREWVRSRDGLGVVSDGFGDFPDIVGSDPLRVAIDVSRTGLTGYEVRSRLAREHRIFLSVATSTAIVAFFGPGKRIDIGRLQDALGDLLLESGEGGSMDRLEVLVPPSAGVRILDPRSAYFSEAEVVPYEEAAGRVSADALSAYPPGIPNVTPGERITPETIEFLRAVAASPIGYVRGALDPEVRSFRVLVES